METFVFMWSSDGSEMVHVGSLIDTMDMYLCYQDKPDVYVLEQGMRLPLFWDEETVMKTLSLDAGFEVKG